MLPVTSGVETGSSAMTDDQDDIVDMLRSAAESTWPNHLLTASAKEIERLRNAGDALAHGIRTGQWDDALDAWTELRDEQ
jgi:hypothetical protein